MSHTLSKKEAFKTVRLIVILKKSVGVFPPLIQVLIQMKTRREEAAREGV